MYMYMCVCVCARARVCVWWNPTVMLPIDRNVKSANYPPQKD